MKHIKAFLSVYKPLKNLSGFFRKKGEIPHYEGVFSHFPSDLGGNVFDQVYWIESVKWYLEKDRVQSRDPKFVLEHYLTVFATLFTVIGSHRKVVALDFGGGIGNTYFPLMSYVPDNLDFEYHIVDTPNTAPLAASFSWMRGGLYSTKRCRKYLLTCFFRAALSSILRTGVMCFRFF